MIGGLIASITLLFALLFKTGYHINSFQMLLYQDSRNFKKRKLRDDDQSDDDLNEMMNLHKIVDDFGEF